MGRLVLGNMLTCPYLNHWENVDEIQALDLMGLQAVRTLHLGQNRNYVLCESASDRRREEG